MKSSPITIFFVLSVIAFSACTGLNKTVDLPANLSETSVYKSFILDTEIDGYEYTENKVTAAIDKRTYIWAQELMASEEKVRDMRFLMYSGLDIGTDGKTDHYIIGGYSDSMERFYYLIVENGEGYVYEVKKPTEFIFSSIDSTSKLDDPADLIAEAVSRGGECPEGVIIELNASKTKAVVGCPGKWKYSDISFLRFSGGSASYSTSGDDE